MLKQALLLASAAILVVAPATAKEGQAKGHRADRDKGAKISPVAKGRVVCPPGLAKKNNGCMPPGRAKKLYNVGQRYPSQYGNRWDYDQIPADLRRRYGLAPNDRYYHRDGYLYRVDPRTMMIEQVVRALIR